MTTTFIHQPITSTGHNSQRSPMAWLATLLRPQMARLGQHTRADKKTVDTAHEIEAVRAMAYRHLRTEPGFAADLFAAADRHQSITDGDTTANPATRLR